MKWEGVIIHTLFTILFIFGLVFLAVLILIQANPHKANLYRQQLQPKVLLDRLQSENLQSMLNHAGVNITAKFYNLVRFGSIIAYWLYIIVDSLFMGSSISLKPVIVTLVLLIVSSTKQYAPMGWILKQLQRHQTIKKNGELISFLKLYENNRLKENGYMQLWAFCHTFAGYFNLLKKDILGLSERAIEDGVEEAMDWFVSRFPADHPFINDVRSIILTTESFKSYEEARMFLKQQNESIAKISSDQYSSRWKFIGEFANVFNTLPSVLTTIMMVVLVMIYISIIKVNL